ncbi:hypothetical protein RCL_jg21537.t1 [Rhizophagus clarus]|uniref:Uncharacterized protein n=1 Tax=Rhizophagus clarus TaxID=94130 RepID=A0A8H3QGY6_9GLOM|nr:hypothetical protein RCL_jg21537.t1 [Rhizophagus clarus]
MNLFILMWLLLIDKRNIKRFALRYRESSFTLASFDREIWTYTIGYFETYENLRQTLETPFIRIKYQGKIINGLYHPFRRKRRVPRILRQRYRKKLTGNKGYGKEERRHKAEVRQKSSFLDVLQVNSFELCFIVKVTTDVLLVCLRCMNNNTLQQQELQHPVLSNLRLKSSLIILT